MSGIIIIEGTQLSIPIYKTGGGIHPRFFLSFKKEGRKFAIFLGKMQFCATHLIPRVICGGYRFFQVGGGLMKRTAAVRCIQMGEGRKRPPGSKRPSDNSNKNESRDAREQPQQHNNFMDMAPSISSYPPPAAAAYIGFPLIYIILPFPLLLSFFFYPPP